MAVDIRDVAKAIGMSSATVSLALNNKGRVSAKTRQLVLDTAREMGYFPSSYARGLRGTETGLIGFQIGHAAEGSPITDSAFATQLLNGASRAALQQGWLVVVVPPNTNREILSKIGIRQAIVLDPVGDEGLFLHVRDSGGSVITIGKPNRKIEDKGPGIIGTIDYGVETLLRTGLDHLFNSGYRRPALLTFSYPISYLSETAAEFKSWANEKNIPAIIASSQKLDIAASAHIARELLAGDKAPDAIYTTNEEGALGVLQAARQLGLRIPEQLGVITTTNTPRVLQSDPSITALDLHPDRIGERAIAMLVNLLSGDISLQHNDVPFDLYIRQSTLKVSFDRS